MTTMLSTIAETAGLALFFAGVLVAFLPDGVSDDDDDDLYV